MSSAYTASARAPQDAASVLATAILQLTVQSRLAVTPDCVPLHAAIAALVRDALAANTQQTVNDIRLRDG
jgi:type II secretory pathway component PulC